MLHITCQECALRAKRKFDPNSVSSAWNYAPVWERAFRSDASPVSWLSSALLLTLAAMALRLAMSLPCYQYRKAPQHSQGEDNLPDDYEV